jgi:hypothetical protein
MIQPKYADRNCNQKQTHIHTQKREKEIILKIFFIYFEINKI